MRKRDRGGRDWGGEREKYSTRVKSEWRTSCEVVWGMGWPTTTKPGEGGG